MASSALLETPSTGGSTAPDFFARLSLSEAQRNAVIFPPGEPLQILAGPGSGKTRTLTARVAYMVDVRGMDPSGIVVVTFTNRAAQEMRSRLESLIGPDRTAKLRMGTFHSLALRYLRRFGHHLPRFSSAQFIVAGEDDVMKIIKKILNELPDEFKTVKPGYRPDDKGDENNGDDEDRMKYQGRILTPRGVRKNISGWKTYNVSVDEVLAKTKDDPSVARRAEGWAYSQYQLKLLEMSALDFDDLILRAIELLKEHPEVVHSVSDVLVDEFQDTSLVQLDLVNLFAQRHKSLTVVGDPDQSIYGWRAADRSNLKRMHDLYGEHDANGQKVVPIVLLEESYRSAGGILSAAQWVIQQDATRPVAKELVAVHDKGQLPTVLAFNSAQDEARWIAQRIQHIVSQSGGLLTHNDFAILVRKNAISRAFEAALAEQRVPVRLLGTVAFFQRREIADMMSYLHLVYNPRFTPSFERVVNVPSRKLGPKFMADFMELSASKGLEPMVYAEQLATEQAKPDSEVLKRASLAALINFAQIILRARKMVLDRRPLSLMLKWVIQTSRYDVFLESMDEYDKQNRINNLVELVSVAAEMDGIKKKVGVSDEALTDSQVLHDDLEQLPSSQLPSQLPSDVQSVPTQSSTQLSSSQQPSSQTQKVVPRPDKTDLSNTLDMWLDSMDVETPEDEVDEFDIPTTTPNAFQNLFNMGSSAKRVRSDQGDTSIKHARTSLDSNPVVRDEGEANDLKDEIEGPVEPSALEKLGELVGMASIGSQKENEDGKVAEAVTISTCHGAKGLEWPAVFVAGCEKDIFPSPMSDPAEEVRLLFVAMTRAEALLYLTCANERRAGTKVKVSGLSPMLRNPEWGEGSNKPFVNPKLKDHLGFKAADATPQLLEVVSKVLNRPMPTTQERANWMQACLRKYNRAQKTERVRPASIVPSMNSVDWSQRSQGTQGQGKSYQAVKVGQGYSRGYTPTTQLSQGYTPANMPGFTSAKNLALGQSMTPPSMGYRPSGRSVPSTLNIPASYGQSALGTVPSTTPPSTLFRPSGPMAGTSARSMALKMKHHDSPSVPYQDVSRPPSTLATPPMTVRGRTTTQGAIRGAAQATAPGSMQASSRGSTSARALPRGPGRC